MPAMERMMAGRGEAGAHRVVAARRPGGGAAEFVPLSAETRLEAWDEAARFLAAGFDRPFSTAALRWEFRHGFLLTARRSGALVGTQGFIPLALGIGDRIVQSAKSERTLLIPAERGTGLFEALYERAVALAADRLGAALLWGLTAVPQAFEKIGYSIFSDVYTHSMIPIGRADAPAAEWKAALLSLAGLAMRPLVTLRLRSPVLFPAGDAVTGGAVRPVLTDALLAWCRDNPDGPSVVHRGAESGTIVFSIDAGGVARLRFLETTSVAGAARLLGEVLPDLTAHGARTVRLSWNAASPTGRVLAALLRRVPYPYRRGHGHFIVRPLAFLDRRLCGHADAWELMGWEDLIHQPPQRRAVQIGSTESRVGGDGAVDPPPPVPPVSKAPMSGPLPAQGR
jgi:hypothetical protein